MLHQCSLKIRRNGYGISIGTWDLLFLMPWSIFGVKGVLGCAWDFATMMATMVMLLLQPFTQACLISKPQNSFPQKVFLV